MKYIINIYINKAIVATFPAVIMSYKSIVKKRHFCLILMYVFQYKIKISVFTKFTTEGSKHRLNVSQFSV
jgi:hypothetical protein